MSFSDAQLERYARHIILKEIGGEGQRRLAQARVAVIGAGGIGSPVIQYLAAAGVGTLVLIDDDIVALSNLQRQTIYRTGDADRPKVEASAEAGAAINGEVAFITHQTRLSSDNVDALLAGADVIVDGCDNFETRLIVADAALRQRIPLVSAAGDQFEGQLAGYRGWGAGKPCYRCFVGHDPARPEMSCADRGVLGPLTGTLGSLAALEAIRALTGFGDDPAGRLLIVDALAFRFRTLMLPKDPGCGCAG